MLEILPGAETAGARSGAPRITPGSESPSSRSGARSASESAKPFLTEVQILTSRPVLETVVTRLRRDGRDVSAFGVDPAAGMQSRLEAIPITSTNVVELVATGVHVSAANLRYLETKARRGRHTLDLPGELSQALNGRTR